MSVRIETKLLVEILADLALTASRGEGFGTDGVLLHCAHGHYDDEPGKTSLLCGTSTNRIAVGYAFTAASGLLPPMLWPITEVDVVLGYAAKVSKGKKDHALEIRREGDEVVVGEDPDLFGDGTSVRFTVGPIVEFPHTVWSTLKSVQLHPVVEVDGRRVASGLRTDYTPAYLAPFVKIGAHRGEQLKTFRYHQRRAVHIQIGPRYRGLVMPASWDEADGDGGAAPDVEVYAPDLPAPAPEGEDNLLVDAADLVLTQQTASAALLQRKLRVGAERAATLLRMLEQRGGIVAPPTGSSKVREVLLPITDKRRVLARIAAESEQDSDGDE